jgi:hypothetical protein
VDAAACFYGALKNCDGKVPDILSVIRNVQVSSARVGTFFTLGCCVRAGSFVTRVCVFPFVQSSLCEEGLEKVSHYVNLVIKYVKLQ